MDVTLLKNASNMHSERSLQGVFTIHKYGELLKLINSDYLNQPLSNER